MTNRQQSPSAALFRALGDPTRLRLLRALSMDCKSVSQLVAESGLPQPAVSHHLAVLKKSGLAHSQRRGAYKFY